MSRARHNKPAAALKLVNLEQGMPTVPLALSLLADALRIARREGVPALKLIHGYGSHGVGGDLRLAIQKTLAQLQRAGELRAFIPGEEWRISNEHCWELLKLQPGLKKDSELGRGNKGISIVVL